MEALCNKCGAPKGLQAVNEACNNNCGGKVIAGVESVMLTKDGCIQVRWENGGQTPELWMFHYIDGMFSDSCKVGESWPMMTEVQKDYINKLEKDELVEGPHPWITDEAGYGYEANEYLGYAITIKNIFGHYVEMVITPNGNKEVVS